MTEDADFIEAIILFAEMKCSDELPGNHRDLELDNIIASARRIRDREGYFVEHSIHRPVYGRRS